MTGTSRFKIQHIKSRYYYATACDAGKGILIPASHAPNPTIRDVLREAGAFAATASLALRNDPRLRKETCINVRGAAEKLIYHPDAVVAFEQAVRLGYRRPALVISKGINEIVDGRFLGAFLSSQHRLPAKEHEGVGGIAAQNGASRYWSDPSGLERLIEGLGWHGPKRSPRGRCGGALANLAI